jgi:vitamin B12/bleomycin/antimicrobial peptide transport system ATP-binding/permease protein
MSATGCTTVLSIGFDSEPRPTTRINAEDGQQFATYVMNLSVGLLTSLVSLVSFLLILWGLSGPAEIPVGRWGVIHIHACLVFAALLSASIGT